MENAANTSSASQRLRLILLACLFGHVLVAIAVYVLVSRATFAGAISSTGAFGPDAIDVLQQSRDLSQLLHRGSVMAWILAPNAIYVKVYSVSYLICARFVGHTILAVEPVNAAYYGCIITLTYKLGKTSFYVTTGKYAALAVAFWPSLVFHMTQPLKDSLFIVA